MIKVDIYIPNFTGIYGHNPQMVGIKWRLKKTLCSILIAGLMSLSSCAHLKYDPAYSGPKKRNEALLEYYNYPEQTIDAKIERIYEAEKYIVKRIEFPSSINLAGNDNICIDYYEQKKDGKFPTILVLPIFFGIDSSIVSFTEYFSSNGFNCAIVHNRDIDLDNIKNSDYVEDYLKQVVLDNRQVLDYLISEEKVDGNRLGCFGISLGGIKVSITAGVDERLRCNVIVLAGGSIADILCYSAEKGIKEYRKVIMKTGVSAERLHSEFSVKIQSDPIKLAPYINAKNVLMYVALFDRIIPRRYGFKLREAIGKPETIYFLTGHYSSILYLSYAKRKSLNFFREKFDMK